MMASISCWDRFRLEGLVILVTLVGPFLVTVLNGTLARGLTLGGQYSSR